MTSLGILASGSAIAADVAIKANATEILEASDNYFLVNSPSGATVKSLTAGTLDVLARTPTTNYLLDSYYSYYKYFGPGSADTSLTFGTPAHARFSIDHTDQLTKYNAAASWTREDVATTQLAETGRTSASRGSITTYAVDGGLTHDLSRIDSLTWTGRAAQVTYSNDPTALPYDDVISTLAWKHSLSPTTILTNFMSFDWFLADNAQQTQRLFWKFLTGVDSKLSPRLTFVGNVGWAFVNAYQNGIAPSTTPFAFQPQVGTANSILADIALTYRLLKTTNLSLIAAQAVAPLTTGQLQKSDSIALILSHDINHFSNLSFAVRFIHIPAVSGSSAFTGQTGTSDFWSASVNYRYQLTREWWTNLSYTYRERDDETGTAKSNTVLFTLSRDFTLLGNPNAINVAERERARERAQQSIGYVFPLLR
jgi:hypothetical protein